MDQQNAISAEEKTSILVAEYAALRDEILKRVEIRFQLTSLTIIIAGTLITAGLQKDMPASVILVYPILCVFLASSWVHHGTGLMRIGVYIRECHETRLDGSMWESYQKVHLHKTKFPGLLNLVASGGIFLSTQAIAVILALFKLSFTPIEMILLVGDLVAMATTFLLLQHYFKVRKSVEN